MCDTSNGHNTGWKVLRVYQYTGMGGNMTRLYEVCRTKDCIERRIETISGAWHVSDFDNGSK